MTFISYAQNFEDVMLWRALQHIDTGFYIDVGVTAPVRDSVTKAFYDANWHGINITPYRVCFEKLKLQRPRDVNLNIAVGVEPGTTTLFSIAVEVQTLTSIWQKHNVNTVHFLKIDVESWEKEILEGFDLLKYRPWIMVIRASQPRYQEPEYHSMLLAANYEYVYFDGLNRFYLAQEHLVIKDCFSTPPNVFDKFIFHREVVAKKAADKMAKDAFGAHTRENQTAKQAFEAHAWARHMADSFEQVNSKLKASEQNRQLITNSLSWRLTAPLRILTRIPQTFSAIAIRSPIRSSLLSARQILIRHPLWRVKFNEMLDRYPRIKKNVLNIAGLSVEFEQSISPGHLQQPISAHSVQHCSAALEIYNRIVAIRQATFGKSNTESTL